MISFPDLPDFREEDLLFQPSEAEEEVRDESSEEDYVIDEVSKCLFTFILAKFALI